MKRLLLLLVLCCTIMGANAQRVLTVTDMALTAMVQLPAGSTAKAPLVVLLHGWGADEQDLFELRNKFPSHYIVVSARAPIKRQAGGYQWYDLMRQGGRTADSAQQDASRALVEQLLHQVVARYNADASHVYLIGFSQGAAMSYAVGLHSPALVHGIGVLSGRLFPSVKVTGSPAQKQLKIFIAHGTADEVVNPAEAVNADKKLRSKGLKPEMHQYTGMGHTITNQELADLLAWMK